MQNLKNKIVFITGASSGIGRACAEQLAALGAKLILTARRITRITQLAADLNKQYGIAALPLQLDVRDPNQVKQVIENLANEWKNIDILINNAGLALATDSTQEGDINNWDTMIDTNIKGLLYVTRAILPGMIARNSGHIINIGSIAGREYYPGGNVYAATKFAVNAISKSLRIDLLGTAIRASEVAPGAVETEFSEVRWKDKERAKEFYSNFTPLTAEDIADAVIYCATRKPHVNIAEILVLPTAQASANFIHRNEKSKGIFDQE